MILQILIVICTIIDIILCIKICYVIKNLYELKYKLIKYNTIIIWNRPDRKYIYKLVVLLLEYICYNLIFDINSNDDIIKKLKNHNTYNILLNTSGGDISSNDILINYICASKIKLNIFVIKKAQSAGTLLALAACKLYIDKDAYLSPTDPQITFEDNIYSIASFMKLCENKDINYITDKYLLNYYECKKLYDENLSLIKKLLENKFIKGLSDNLKNKFIHELTSGDYSHHKPLSGMYINKFLNINLTFPSYILDIYKLFEDFEYYI